MQLKFYGVRGSYPTASRDQLKYGGNTTCLHFVSRAGRHLILDGGSGIRVLGNVLMQQEFGDGQGQAAILVGHTHWDHIMGYPFFKPFYQPGNRFLVASAGQTNSHIRDIMEGQYTDLNFPVSFEYLSAEFDFLSFHAGDRLDLGDFQVETVQLNHPGITVGYRIEADGACVTVFTDNGRVREVRLGDGMGGPDPDDAFAADFLARLTHCVRYSDLLVHDTQFFEYEMAGRYHWGHSTVEDAIELAHSAGVKKLALFHYDPNHSDTIIDRQLTLARDLTLDDPLEIMAAAEGLELMFDGQGGRL